MTVNITAHKMSFHTNVIITKSGLTDIAFPFPIQTELGTPVKAETGKDISIDSGTFAILSISGTVPSPKLIVITED